MSKITVTCHRDPTQGTKIEVEGHPGPGCQQLTAAIEKALGTTVKDQTTDEFYQAPQQEQQHQTQ